MNRKTTKKVDESTLTTLCAVCRGAFLDAKGVRLRRADPRQTITQLAQKDTGSSANRHMRQILRIYNGASREMSLPLKN